MPTLQGIVAKRRCRGLTGRKERMARKILQSIREKSGKEKNSFVAIGELRAHRDKRIRSEKSHALLAISGQDTVITHPIIDRAKNGHLQLSDHTGLGVDLVEEEMENHPGVLQARSGFYV